LAVVKNLEALNGLSEKGVRERHRIYSLLLMRLIERFWNGNKLGPVGKYPERASQVELPLGNDRFRYHGDLGVAPGDSRRIRWDRYLGHNIACLAVDGTGEIIDFEFNHNELFRSSAEHAEARLVRRIFSLADLFDHWNTGRVPQKARATSLSRVTIYTSLESCAQCSGVMSLGRVKEVVFLQHDPGAYRVGNIMYNLSDLDSPTSTVPTAPLPIPGDVIGLPHLTQLDQSYTTFLAAQKKADVEKAADRAFFISMDNVPDFSPSITSFLCTDSALDIFRRAGREFESMTVNGLRFAKFAPATPTDGSPQPWTNEQCLKHAQGFYQYADVEGFRGSPHR
jgi:tRNA(Arg) A34 adenosine deaminase TadA